MREIIKRLKQRINGIKRIEGLASHKQTKAFMAGKLDAYETVLSWLESD